jgi:hypothetical protein
MADKVWAFSAYDGSLVSKAYIPNDGRQKQVVQVAQLPNGHILMADVGNDQSCSADDAVREYTACGQYIRTVASPADGVCNPESIAIAYGKVWISRLYEPTQETTAGVNALWSMNYDGSGLTQVCASPSFGKIWYITPFNGGFLVGDSADNNIEFAPVNCATSTPFYTSGGSGVSPRLPHQLSLLQDGTVAAAFFGASGNSSAGIYFFSPTGDLTGIYGTPACRGVCQLDNGEILMSGGTQVIVYNPVTATTRTIVNQLSPLASFRGATRIQTCPADLDCDGTVSGGDLGLLLGGWGQPGRTDLNHDGTTDGADLGIMLAAWGSCSY